jgi:hypothetical protein
MAESSAAGSRAAGGLATSGYRINLTYDPTQLEPSVTQHVAEIAAEGNMIIPLHQDGEQ